MSLATGRIRSIYAEVRGEVVERKTIAYFSIIFLYSEPLLTDEMKLLHGL